MIYKEKYVKVRDGMEIFVRSIGHGEPVLFLHGFGMDSKMLIPLVLPLCYKYKFILPDFRGFGRNGEVNFNTEDCFLNYYNDLEDILDSFSINNITVAGISLGAYVPLYWLSKKGSDRIKKFLCIDQSPTIWDTKEYKFGLGCNDHHQWMADIDNLIYSTKNFTSTKSSFDLPEEYKEQFISIMKTFFAAGFPQLWIKFLVKTLLSVESCQKIFLPNNSWPQWHTLCASYLHNKNYNLIDKVQTINIPVTIMCGLKNDTYPPESSYFLHKQIKNSKLIEFKNSGHCLLYTESFKFIKEFKVFLEN